MPDLKLIKPFHVIPGSAQNKIVGFMDNGSIKIKIKSQPEKGKANYELINYLAKIFGMPKKNISFVSGFQSREKTLCFIGLTEDTFQRIISNLTNQEP